METTLIKNVVGIILSKLTTMIEQDMKLRKELKDDLQDIKYEMDMINEAIRKHAASEGHRGWIREVQELAYDIEDCIDQFKESITCSPKAGWFHKKLHGAKTVDARTQFAKDIRNLRERARKAYERRNRYLNNAAPPPETAESVSTSSTTPYTPEAELVGIAEPKQELLELLKPADDGEPERLRVISILGFRGIGKTTLAKVVFDSLVGVPSRAWVVASQSKDERDLLSDISFQLRGGTKDTSSTLAQLGENLCLYLQTQHRYLIVIDEVQKEVWGTVKSSFPLNTCGRIIVTTSIQSIARTCSSDGGYVYQMKVLNEGHSKDLLLKEIFGSQAGCSYFDGQESILKKCDGLPLALVNIAQFLKPNSDRLTTTRCSKVCRDLGSHLQNDKALSRMKQVLIHTYDNLPGHDLKTCLLSVSIFPKDHRIKRKSLVRRWLAEGLVIKDIRRDGEDVADGYFEELVNQSIVQPVHKSNNAEVKTCQVHGVVLDFIVHKSVSENFLTLIHNNELIPNKETTCAVRRLSLQNTTAGSDATLNIDLSRIRSLTIFGHVGDCVNFQKCKMLRVLDLENFEELKNIDLQYICKLLQLKYLSLRGTDVSELPNEISNLHYLETLDMRGENVIMLPLEVLNLPQLAHLLGRFKLPRRLNKVGKGHKLLTIISEKSKLQTLAGFVMDGNHGFQHIMHLMKKLRKVKIWSESTPIEDSTDLLVTSLQNRFFGTNALQSLSIDFGDHSIDFLDSLTVPCVLSSVKLHGKLTGLPDFIRSLQDLELHLRSVGLSCERLSVLQKFDFLLYLKLVEDCPEFVDGSFSVESNGFPRLRRLCIQSRKLPKLSIAVGAMRCLTSLQLICADISGLPLEDITHLEGLKEVTLASSVSAGTRKSWETAAKQHKNRPAIYEV